MKYLFQNNFEASTQKEWLVTNGIGGFASSSVSGANSRRYHGILVAAFNPPTDRKVLVSKIEERVSFEDKIYEFSTNNYGNIFHPTGWEYLTSFERLPIPQWIFEGNNWKVSKSLFMVQGVNKTIISYQNLGSETINLSLNPLFVFRDYHSLFHENASDNFFVETSENQLKIYPHYQAEPTYFRFSTGNFREDRHWYKNLTYTQEKERGLDFQEDAYSIGTLEITLPSNEECFLIFSTTQEALTQSPEIHRQNEIERINSLQNTQSDTFLKDLLITANQFIVQRKSTQSETIIAGYHWFTDWGRDTMIAMRGLCISLGKQDTAKHILTTFLNYLDGGMLPNRFPDNSQDSIEYNTIDATLWLFVTLYEYHQKFKDLAFIQTHYDQLCAIIEAHKNGTRYGIYVIEDGFLCGGEGNIQLTWMDAKVGDYVVTPRHGCPVEVNALWYNTLKINTLFGKLLKKDTVVYEGMAEKFEQNFKLKFWNENGYLNDVITPNQNPDTSIRPNQIYALSLPFPLLNENEQKQVLATVTEHLYTPLGLRTLSPNDPNFKPFYGGDQWQRDSAYHQGTVWIFLLGEYWQAYMRVHDFSDEANLKMFNSMESLKNHFYQHDCLYGISEIFDGLTPKDGRGTVNQAWSLGAIIKLLCDYSVH